MKTINTIHKKVKLAVLGASGYTGIETIRLVLNHPYIEIIALSADKHAGKELGLVFSQFSKKKFPILQKIHDIDFTIVDIVFSCLPAGSLNKIIDIIPEKIKILDLSPDFRFENINTYEEWYGKHLAASFSKKSVYGLSEIYRKSIKKRRIIACPGCYPTSVLLPLIPLLKKEIINTNHIIIDSKSGSTGAGRTLSQNLLFSEVNESIKAYGNGAHRHMPEIKEQLDKIAKKNINIVFNPHLVPMKRGILSCIYVLGDSEKIYKELKRFYKTDIFVDILNLDQWPSTNDVVGSNKCKIGVSKAHNSKYTIIVSVLDNLIKGASGQALQNFNIMFNFKEDLGLAHYAFYP